ncbi:hypothetical protein J3L16_00960 [Alteromonas sp. 5E99-2]|uniref:hypothetical protein n=1 Tax=Alteromonas sp. 5E99-2 TaxID=2817683 RepID=UPI001A990410|nr:hypothetical protein [Alteromonas sp. 5E99-2]MBO1254248.1 hypothetical protein [Alteromonas sp. 5E99-2]
MKKFIIAGVLMVLASANASASFIDVITADQLAGAEITVTFDSGFTETSVFEVVDTEAVETGADSFSLSLAGETFGEFATGEGFWSFTNNFSANPVTSIVIDLLSIDAVFDPVFDGVDGPGGAGRDFVANIAGLLGVFTNAVVDGELFNTLTITGAFEDSFLFAVDTDIESDVTGVPAPAVFSLIMLVLGGLVVRRNKA